MITYITIVLFCISTNIIVQHSGLMYEIKYPLDGHNDFGTCVLFWQII